MAIQSQNKKTGHGGKLGFANGVVVFNHQRQIVACTPGARRLLGLRTKRTSRKESPLPSPLDKIIRKAAASKHTAIAQTVTLPSANGQPARLRVSAVPFAAGSNRRYVALTLNELSTAERIDTSLARLDRLANLGTLSASLAHEIKNALVAVKTFTDLLLEKNPDAELNSVVRREMSRIDSIVSQMLKFGGPARPAFSVLRVHGVLDQSLRMVQSQVEDRLISLDRAFNAAPDAITGDDYQLEQVFVNLLLNAIEAMGPNGRLTVATDLISTDPTRSKSARRSGAHLRVAISDTGVGISPENLRRLFEPFFTTKQQGTGLGLTIARRIVREHRGDIRVQSQVNQGTTFSVLLPVHT